MSMPPEPVTGFCILPRVATMSSTSARRAAPSTQAAGRVLAGQLPVARGVEVERLDGDAHLVGPQLRARVEAAGRLRQGDGVSRGLEHSVQAHREEGDDTRGAAGRSAAAGSGSDTITNPSVSAVLWRRSSVSIGATKAILYESVVWTCLSLPPADVTVSRMGMVEQPYEYRRRELVEPDWTRFPGWAGVTQADWDSAQWQRVNCVRNIKQLRALMGDLLDERFYDDLAKDQSRARDDVDARAAADAQHDGAVDRRADAVGRPRLHRRLLRRPHPQLHAAGLLRPAHRLAVAPARLARLPPRARHVGGRGPHPPLPHQGARRAAPHLPAVLRALHPHGPRRQLDPPGRQAEVRPQARRPVCRDARLPAHLPRRARRRRLRWRRRQHAVEEPRGLHRPAPRHRQHPRHPARDEGPDGPAAALVRRRRRRGRGPGVGQGALAGRLARDPHARQQRPVAHALGRPGLQGDARRRGARRAQPGRAHARRQRLDGAAPRPVLRRSPTAPRSRPTTSTCAT